MQRLLAAIAGFACRGTTRVDLSLLLTAAVTRVFLGGVVLLTAANG